MESKGRVYDLRGTEKNEFPAPRRKILKDFCAQGPKIGPEGQKNFLSDANNKREEALGFQRKNSLGTRSILVLKLRGRLGKRGGRRGDYYLFGVNTDCPTGSEGKPSQWRVTPQEPPAIQRTNSCMENAEREEAPFVLRSKNSGERSREEGKEGNGLYISNS